MLVNGQRLKYSSMNMMKAFAQALLSPLFVLCSKTTFIQSKIGHLIDTMDDTET
jgi:hypothetical protein